MQVTGIIGTNPEQKKDARGRPYFRFRLAEGFGTKENRRTTWYDVYAFIPLLEGAALAKPQLVSVKGELKPYAYKVGAEERIGLRILAFSVEPVRARAA